MNEYLIFLLKSSSCMAVLYLFYAILLRKDTFFKINRIFLLASIFAGLFIPLFKIPVVPVPIRDNLVGSLETITVTGMNISESINSNSSIISILTIVYYSVAFVLALQFIFRIIKILNIILRFGVLNRDGIKLVITDDTYSPFSFFNYVFVSRKNYKGDELSSIIAHEKIHIINNHSLDLIFIELINIFFWMNPFIYLYKNSIKALHEYIADDGAVNACRENSNYRQYLLKSSTGISFSTLSNNFNHSLIYRRLKMLSKARSPRLYKAKALFSLPIIVLMLLAFSTNIASVAKPASEIDKKNTTKAEFKKVDVMPEFPGGQSEMVKFLASNLKYPEIAKAGGYEGTVYVKFTVKDDGSISDVKPCNETKMNTVGKKKSKINTNINEIKEALENEAIRVVLLMPKWKPAIQNGNPVLIEMNIPIKYRLK